MTYPVTDNKEAYSSQMQILVIPHREDVNKSKQQTPHKLHHQRRNHVAEIKREHITLSRLDDAKNTWAPAQVILKSSQELEDSSAVHNLNNMNLIWKDK